MSKLAKILKARATAWADQRVHDGIGVTERREPRDDDGENDESGIHDSRSLKAASTRKRAVSGVAAFARANGDARGAAAHEVTLIVYAWHNVQPGPMSWLFPNARNAIAAAKAMRNAVSWAIVRGNVPATALEESRVTGAVVLEHTS